MDTAREFTRRPLTSLKLNGSHATGMQRREKGERCSAGNCTQSGPYPTSDVVKMVGATFRQLDHWSRRGYVRPLNPTPGSGIQREWSPLDIRAARVLVSVSNFGSKSDLIFRAASAAIYRAGDKPNAKWLMVYCEADDPYGIVRPHPLTSADMPVFVCPLPPLDDPEAL
jgi:hypothetical protein